VDSENVPSLLAPSGQAELASTDHLSVGSLTGCTPPSQWAGRLAKEGKQPYPASDGICQALDGKGRFSN